MKTPFLSAVFAIFFALSALADGASDLMRALDAWKAVVDDARAAMQRQISIADRRMPILENAYRSASEGEVAAMDLDAKALASIGQDFGRAAEKVRAAEEKLAVAREALHAMAADDPRAAAAIAIIDTP